jgi:sodium-dependent phosphate cotransporter
LTDNSTKDTQKQVWLTIRTTLSIIGALLLFFFAIDLMVSSLQELGGGVAETILLATSNPFTGLFIGLLITAMIQSSSTTTSLIVAFVASGSITLESAVPLIMGANIGTTITSTIISLGFINKKKEFKRAVAAGTYHDFFNILTVIILFPLEYYYGFLSSLATVISTALVNPAVGINPIDDHHFGWGFGGIINWLVSVFPSGFALVLLAFALLFGSILLFRKLISNLLLVQSPEKLGSFFFGSPLKSFAWGLTTTAAIRSSTITTSLVVPLVAKQVIKLKAAAPYILGANIGTTITAFIAAILYANNSSAVTIAIAHFLFNFIGVIIFFPIPILRKVPLDLASFLGKLTLKYRLVGFVYLLSAFFFIPFSLIYFNKNSIENTTAVYEVLDKNGKPLSNKMVARINSNTRNGQWIEFAGDADSAINTPNKIQNISYRDNVFFVSDQMYMFSKQGFCWDGEDDLGKYKVCVDSILTDYRLTPDVTLPLLYHFKRTYYDDSLEKVSDIFISPDLPIIIKQNNYDSTGLIATKRLLTVEKD